MASPHEKTVKSLFRRLRRCPAIAPAIGLFFVFSVAQAYQERPTSATLKAVKQATVYLRVTFTDDTTVQGSGFFAGESNMVLTNAHVVGMLKDGNHFPRHIEVVVNSGQEAERMYQAELVGVDPELDLALLSVAGARLPPPLQVTSGRELEETQSVFIFGFPLGVELGKHITVVSSSISSLRKDEAGVLERIQVNGGMHPGNSGGPVVDAKGQVVGVAVAAVRNTQIQFAVPGERVLDFLGGRVGAVLVGKPRQRAGKLVANVSVPLIDPMKRIRSVSLDYWLGAKGKPRPPSSSLPGAVKGDTARQSLALHLADGLARGKWTVPLPDDGQVIWAQPRYVLKGGETRWTTSSIMRPSPPEEEPSRSAAGRNDAVYEEKRQAAAQKDLKAMEGTWKLVRREVSGSLENVDHLKLAVVIEDDKITWTQDEKDTGLKATLDLDPTATPRAMDIELIGPKRMGEQRLGIYDIQGDKLVFCWNKAQDKRPRKFTTHLSIGCGMVHETYRRVPD